jgi:penicillin-binding protein 2
MAIGQSTLQVTPLQMTRAMAAIANGGRLVTPRFVKRVGSIDVESGGQSDSLPDTSSSESISLDQHTLAEVRRGLERVVADEDGSGHRSIYLDHLAIAGKTGTAETGPGRADHAWFVGYAPADRPSIAVGVVIEHAGSGGGVAGPIAKRLIMKLDELGYFHRRGRADAAALGAASTTSNNRVHE